MLLVVLRALLVGVAAAQEHSCAVIGCGGNDGTCWCEKQGRSIEKPMRRYILSCQGSDTTGSTWLSAFDDQAKVLLGHTADELAEIKEGEKRAPASAAAQRRDEDLPLDCATCRPVRGPNQRVARARCGGADPRQAGHDAQRLPRPERF